MVARLIIKGGQKLYRVYRAASKKKAPPHGEGIVSKKFQGRYFVDYKSAAPVSYTHLTLPTNREV